MTKGLFENINDFMRKITPAIKGEDGKVHIGSRSEAHIDIRHRKSTKEGPLRGEAGYWHREKKKFYPKYGKDGLNIDSTMLRRDKPNSAARMLKYGTFEEEKEE